MKSPFKAASIGGGAIIADRRDTEHKPVNVVGHGRQFNNMVEADAMAKKLNRIFDEAARRREKS